MKSVYKIKGLQDNHLNGHVSRSLAACRNSGFFFLLNHVTTRDVNEALQGSHESSAHLAPIYGTDC